MLMSMSVSIVRQCGISSLRCVSVPAQLAVRAAALQIVLANVSHDQRRTTPVLPQANSDTLSGTFILRATDSDRRDYRDDMS